ncbi:DUF2076 domain-containing protein [Rubritepida flocculans]|uniref:DUF2076 domain-containing protein n=1 Tax=Rubritepida flocculans TaxID=182403 RepID=UPI000422E0F1|nr:DUF2076 family protein [Rubritepida flocculans]
MTEEERRIITDFVARMAGVQQAAPAPGPWGGRVPQTGAAPARPLPPIDPEADALIAELFQRYPEARFRLTQTAFVQEHALVAAQNRIQELEWELENARRQAEAANNRGFFGFGGSRPAPMPPRPAPMQAPGGPLPAGRQGPGFLGTAAMTAAGVAGGIILGNLLMNAFSGGGAAQAATGGGAFGQEAVPASSPWTDPGAAAQPSGWGGADATGGYDSGDDASGGYDDAGGGYDDEF